MAPTVAVRAVANALYINDTLAGIIVGQLDTDGNGVISKRELRNWTKAVQVIKDTVMNAFLKHDRQRTGNVTLTAAQQVMEELFTTCEAEYLNSMISAFVRPHSNAV